MSKNETIQTAENYGFPSYTVMVERLFKRMDDSNNPYSGMMHAAIGIAGEVPELLGAITHENMIEECGDLEFYLEAMLQRCPEGFRETMAGLEGSYVAYPLYSVLAQLQQAAGGLLDIVKKSWVYNKPMDNDVLYEYVANLRISLIQFYGVLGTDANRVRLANQIKLIGPNGRFRSGFYSDDAAQSRADKADEKGITEDAYATKRSYIGAQK